MKRHLLALVLVAAAAVAVTAQTPLRPGNARTVPRTADGHPDLQGVYDLATLTPVERRAGSPLVLTDEDAKKLEQQVADRYAKADAPIEANRAAPPKGGDGSPGPYGNVGGYNNFWLDHGSHYTVVDGQKRASLLIDPPDGRVPPRFSSAHRR